MRYRTYLSFGILCLAIVGVLSHQHVDEENSPLVFGLVALGLSAIVSPLILSRSPEEEQVFRPSGRAMFQSVLFPLVGVVLTAWGVLGEVGVLQRWSFDGAKQHCRACGTNWLLGGPRGENLHYVDACEHCVRLPALRDEMQAMLGEICARLSPKPAAEPQPGEGEESWPPAPAPEPRAVRPQVAVANRSNVRLAEHELAYDVEQALKACPALALGPMYGDAPLEFRLAVDPATGEPAAGAHRLHLRLALVETATGQPLHTAERERAFATEPVPR